VGYASGEVRLPDLLRNWGWVYLGNLLGSVAYALLFAVAITNFSMSNGGALGDQVRRIAQAKTLGYMALGARGWGTAFVKAILCNWMVTVGAVLALTSRSTIGKIAAMWLPITTFFALGYEHSVVNMFVVPAGVRSRSAGPPARTPPEP
jgi:formate/nitrite transporter FocA (FNT family)